MRRLGNNFDCRRRSNGNMPAAVVAKAKSFVGVNILLTMSAGIAPIVAVKPILWGRNQPNGLGLYNMSGNVSEWVQDWRYNIRRHGGSRIELAERFDSIFRGVRGGSWFSLSSNCRSAKRSWFRESEPLNHVGFRLARKL